MSAPTLFELFFNEMGDGLVALDLGTRKILNANKAFEFFTGLTADEYQGESLNVISEIPASFEITRERKLTFELLSNPGTYNDVVLSHKMGTCRFVTLKVVHATLGDSQKIALLLMSDDTERQFLVRDLMMKHQTLESAHGDLETAHQKLKVSGEKIMQASKMAALGELATGLSHELNQPLTGIRGFAQEINDILKTDPKPKKDLIQNLSQEVISNVDKMAKLLAHFRTFARGGAVGKKGKDSPADPVAESIKVQDLLDKTLRLFSHQFESHKIQIEIVCSSDIKKLSLHTLTQPFEQVLINLLSNARDACDMSSRAKKKIQISIEFSKQNPEQIEIRVTDNGSGIKDETKLKIFDPFYTTKDTGKGTGLGLSISYSLALKLGGELALEHSVWGEGTTFLWTLPVKFDKSKIPVHESGEMNLLGWSSAKEAA